MITPDSVIVQPPASFINAYDPTDAWPTGFCSTEAATDPSRMAARMVLSSSIATTLIGSLACLTPSAEATAGL